MGEAAFDTEVAGVGRPLPEATKSVDELIAATGGGVNAIFGFEHKVFALPGARFAVDRQAETMMFYIRLGNLHVALLPRVLRREFNIATLSHDSQLIELASHALRHVKEVRPGDSIPKELVDGSASWSVDEHHRLVARAKLLFEVVHWRPMEGSEISVESLLAITDAEIAARDEFKKGFAAIAQALGVEPSRRREILDQIDTVARELCYIEALREYTAQLRTIKEKVTQLAHISKGDPAIHDEVGRVLILLKPALVEFVNRFTEVDAEASDILALLRNPSRQVRGIRDARDEIHLSLMPWADVFERWKDQEVVMNHVMDENIHALYAMLAANYAPSRTWR
jgi:hypothetical protein